MVACLNELGGHRLNPTVEGDQIPWVETLPDHCRETNTHTRIHSLSIVYGKPTKVPQKMKVTLFKVFKVVSAILGRNINYLIHLIFPHDPLAA